MLGCECRLPDVRHRWAYGDEISLAVRGKGAAGIRRSRIILQITSQYSIFVPEETPGNKISPSVLP